MYIYIFYTSMCEYVSVCVCVCVYHMYVCMSTCIMCVYMCVFLLTHLHTHTADAAGKLLSKERKYSAAHGSAAGRRRVDEK